MQIIFSRISVILILFISKKNDFMLGRVCLLDVFIRALLLLYFIKK